MITSLMSLKSMLQEASVLVLDGQGYRIAYCEEAHLMGIDEVTGDEVTITYDEIDLTRDFLYKLTLMKPFAE